MSSSPSSHANDASAALADLSEIWIGFIGCGKISSAVAEGYATAPEPHRPRRIIVSQRSVEKSRELKQKFPQLVEVAESTEDIIGAADVIFIGLLPTVARQLLPTLTFRPKTIIVSMMAVMDIDEVVSLVRVKRSQVVRTVPLTSCSRRSGPILIHPPNPPIECILRIVGTPIQCAIEKEMKPLVAITGHISPFFELLSVTEAWATQNGVAPEAANAFVSAFYTSMANSIEPGSDFGEHSVNNATPGGINEQALGRLRASDHFELIKFSLSEILHRLNGGGK